jgi:cytochrome c biogenesis protein ResB
MKLLWRWGNSLLTTLWLTALLVADLALGYSRLRGNTPAFTALNQIGLGPWLLTYARNDPGGCGWFVVLLLLLLLLGLNTLICTLTRLLRIGARWHRQKHLPAAAKPRLAAHLMHLGIVVILAGYLLSYTGTTVYPALTLIPQHPLRLYGTPLRLELEQMRLDYYEGRRLEGFSGRVLRPHLAIRIYDQAAKTERTAWLTFNQPLFHAGYGIFLQRFHPTSHGGMNSARYAVVEVRRDPGVRFHLIGILIFLVGLTWFVALTRRGFGRSNNKRKGGINA